MKQNLPATTATALAATVIAFAPQSFASDSATQTITAQCTTKATGIDGRRHGCRSDITTLNAPPGFVFVQNSVNGGMTSANGSEHACHFAWDNFVEVLPGTGITQPTQARLYARARSGKGHFSGRGWAKCYDEIKLVRYSATLTK